MQNKIILTITAFAALTAALPGNPTHLFRRDCPDLTELSQEYGCKIFDKKGCELCCPPKIEINPKDCHGGHDKPNPCREGWEQWHCEEHIAQRRA